MKTNKGIAGLGIVLIIVGVLAVGGVAYYAGTTSNSVPVSPSVATPSTPSTTTTTPTTTPVTSSTTTTTTTSTSCNWEDTYNLTTTDGALGQTCLSWVQSFAGSSITQNQLRVPSGTSQISTNLGNCVYKKEATFLLDKNGTLGTTTDILSEPALYSDLNWKPIRAYEPGSLKENKTQVCI